MSAGAGMQFAHLAQSRTLTVAVLSIRHFLLPIVALGLAQSLRPVAGADHHTAGVLALPTASSAYVLAARMGYNGAYVAGLVTLSTMLGVVSLPFALAVLDGSVACLHPGCGRSAEACWPGLARRLLTFRFAKRKVSKRKGDPGCCVPPLHGQPAVLGPGASRYTRFAQTTRSLIRLNLRSSAHPQGVGKEYQYATEMSDSPWRVLVCLGIDSLYFVPAPACPVLAGPRSAETSGSGQKLV